MSVRIGLNDKDLFGNDAGEDEDPAILSSYFVPKPAFSNFLFPQDRLAIVRGRKGMGKSSLLAKLAYDLKKAPEAIVIQATGSDFPDIVASESDNAPQLISRWQQRLCALILARLAQGVGFANDETKTLIVEAAELEGVKERNLLGFLIERFRTKIGMDRLQAVAPATLLGRALATSDFSRLPIWLLIDDIDATFLNRPGERLRTSTFFSACRTLANNFQGIHIRTSVRTDVWSLLRRFDEALDKAEQYVTDVQWSRDETIDIIASKIRAYVQRRSTGAAESLWRVESHRTKLLQLVIEPQWEWDDHHVSPDRPIFVLSGGRPRWAAQLLKLSAKGAHQRAGTRIATSDWMGAMPEFGALRLDDLYREHSHQCPELQAVIQCFSGGPSIYTTQELLQLLTDKILKVKGPIEINGEIANETPLALARLLFQSGFLCGRRNDIKDWVTFDERPQLLATKVNLDDGMDWEIQVPYRSALNIYRRKRGR